MTRVVMLEIGGLGFVRSIRPGPRKLRGDGCILVVDEQNKALWFWMGSGVQYDKRRTAKAKAEKISLEGQRIGPEVLGQGFSLILIDQDGLEEPTTANNYSNLIALLDSPMEIRTIADPKGTLIIGNLQVVAPTATPLKVSTSTTAEPSPADQPPPRTAVKKGTKLDLEAALMAIIRVHNEVHIEYRSHGETEEVIIESIDGLQHKMKRSKGKLTFNWDSKTPKELKELVALELKRFAA
ncbi:MAG: hypothetical protein ACFFD8_08605 [Candidatus Thorarchaeota archaeon]